jgi:filamentous hemagglutinin
LSISAEKTEYHEQLHEEHREKIGFLSSTKMDIYDRQTLDAVIRINISADRIDITTGKEINISGFSVMVDNDVKAITGVRLEL